MATTQRTFGLGYAADTVRKQFTGYERDIESDLDFAEARYYNKNHGRFTSVDPLMASASQDNPQTWNRYIYCLNNPLTLIDPSGESPGDYYDRDDGSYLGNDGVDDHKVYSGKEQSRTERDGKIYRQVGEVHDLGISDVEFNTISNIVRQEGATNDTNEYLWIAHASNNQASATNQSLSGLLSTGYSSVPNKDKTQLSPEDNSLRANAARAGVIHVLSGGADPTSGATLWDGTDFILRGRSHPKFSQYDSVVIREDVFNNFSYSQGGSSIRLKGQRYTNPNPFFGKNHGSWNLDGNPESGFAYRKNNGRGVLYATGTAGKSIFWSTNYKWNK
jgi:RHS repeat-associated protein